MVKEQSLSVLIKTCDEVFSEFVRLRDTKSDGFVYCFICGKHVTWKGSHCGHYIGRAQMAVRFDEKNAHAICFDCNVLDTKHQMRYMQMMEFHYGHAGIKELFQKSKSLAKFTRPELQQLISEYKEKVKELRKQKHL